MASRSSGVTSKLRRVVSSMPNPIFTRRNSSQRSSQVALKCASSSVDHWRLPAGTEYCGVRWKEVRWPTTFAASVMNWTPVEPLPITPMR